MSDLKTQRNVAIGVAALAMAFVVGYLVANNPRTESAPPTAAESSSPAQPVAAVQDPGPTGNASEPPSATSTSEPAPRAAAPPAGTRTRQEPARTTPAASESLPAPTQAAGAPEPEAEPAATAAPEPQERRMVRVRIPEGTKISLELVQGVSSQTAQPGQEVAAELVDPIRVDGRIVVAAGTRVDGQVTEAQALKKIGGKAILGLSFDRLESGDGGVAISAAFRREGKSETGKDAATIAAGAAIGTILGNQAKHNDRGKLIGAVVGAAAGTAVAAKTEGEKVELPDGARLELTLQQPVEVLIEAD